MIANIPVAVFAKPPIPGAVKTRLARRLGDDAAARLARAFLRDTWALVRALPWARPILASTSADLAAFDLEGDPEVWLQGEGDLGDRMERVILRGLDSAPAAFVLGADVPGLPADHLDQARARLTSHDVVLGPSDDGGFHLLGASRLPRGALAALAWSRDDTRIRTEAKLAGLGLSIAHSPAWFDVDEPDDLLRLARHLADDPRAAPHTRAALAVIA